MPPTASSMPAKPSITPTRWVKATAQRWRAAGRSYLTQAPSYAAQAETPKEPGHSQIGRLL